MEKTEEESKVGDGGPKHSQITETKDEVEIVENKHIKNTASPFINETKSWDDENLTIPEDIKNNIK